MATASTRTPDQIADCSDIPAVSLPPNCLEEVNAMFAPDHVIAEAAETLHAGLLDTQSESHRKRFAASVLRNAIRQVDSNTARSQVVRSQERSIRILEQELEQANDKLRSLKAEADREPAEPQQIN